MNGSELPQEKSGQELERAQAIGGPGLTAFLCRKLVIDENAAAILACLIGADGSVVSKDDLLEAGWRGRIVHENSLAKAIGRLRIALGPRASCLQAAYGRGYRFDCPGFLAELGQDAETDVEPALAIATEAPRSRRLAWALALVPLALLAGGAAYLSRPAPVPAPSPEAEALLAFISNDLILPTDPYADAEPNPALRDVVERTAESMDERFAGQPASLVALNQVLARAFSGWGQYDRAVNHLSEARANALLAYPGNMDKLVEIDAALCQQMRLAGETRRAEEVCTRAVETGEGIDSADRFLALANLGKLQFEVGSYGEALATMDRVLDTGASEAETGLRADATWFRALSLRKLARFEEAERDFEALLEMQQDAYGNEHPLTAWALSDYGDFLVQIGEFDRALQVLEQAQRTFDLRLGPDHVESQSPAYSVALVHMQRGDAAKAEEMLSAILANYQTALGREHFWSAYVMTELANAQAVLGKHDEAQALLREVRALAAAELHGRPAKAAAFHLRWANAFAEMRELETARDELRRARSAVAKGFDAGHPWLVRADCIAARIELQAGRVEQARASASACSAGVEEASLPPRHPLRAEALRVASAVGAGALAFRQ